MTYPSRPYVFRPRPRHRETLDSYSNRVLTANAETAEHRAHLTTLERKNNPQLTRVEAWKQALARKLERDTLDLTANPAGWLTHRDGTSCLHCAALLGPRVLCTLCAHGERIEQHPHFDGMVCVRHRRWVGLGDNPSLQHPVDDACIKTEHHFRRLKRENRIDVRLYLTVITAQWPSGLGSEAELPARFPVAIAIIAALTTRQFTRRFFDPANTYAQAFAYLNDTLRKVFGEPAENLAREVWLYARATFWTIRASVQAGAIEPAVWHHDYPLDSDILQSYIDNGIQPEAFDAYLPVSGDDNLTIARRALPVLHKRYPTAKADGTAPRTEVRICSKGHQYLRPRTPLQSSNTSAVECRVCANRFTPGVNDVATKKPAVVSEFAIDLNGGLTAGDVPASSTTPMWWRCPQGHDYEASPSARVHGGINCAICSHRTIVAGINDIATTHPEIAAEWDPSWLHFHSPTAMSFGSSITIGWVCSNGHRYKMRIYDRTHGHSCPDCLATADVNRSANLVLANPKLAAEWNYERNGERRPENFTVGSHFVARWNCPFGHVYPQRIDRRVAGYECQYCSHRKVAPGVNDLATTDPELMSEFHPYMNHPKTPDKMLAGTDLYWWKCVAAGHKVQQSVPNRRHSRGCKDCPEEARVMFDEATHNDTSTN